MTGNTNDGITDGFANIRPEHQWQAGAAFAWLESNLNQVHAVVIDGQTAPDDFQLLLMELREQFGHAMAGAPRYLESDGAWLYLITVYRPEVWSVGAVKAILDRQAGLLTIESDDSYYADGIPVDDVDAMTAALNRVGDDWQAFVADLTNRFEITDDIGEPGYDQDAGKWVYELPLGSLLVEKDAA